MAPVAGPWPGSGITPPCDTYNPRLGALAIGSQLYVIDGYLTGKTGLACSGALDCLVEDMERGGKRSRRDPVPEMVDADRADGSRLLTGPTGFVDSA